jgi:hypothetical protein
VLINNPAPQHTLQITNQGGVDLILNQITFGGTVFSPVSPLISFPATILPNAMLTFYVKMADTTAGSYSDPMTIQSNDPTSPFTLNLSGTVNAAAGILQVSRNGELIASGSQLDFGQVSQEQIQQQTATRLLTITNASTATAALTGITVNLPPSGGFTLVGPAPPTTLDIGQSATFHIEFDPSAPGLTDGIVTIASSDASSPFMIPIDGYELPSTENQQARVQYLDNSDGSPTFTTNFPISPSTDTQAGFKGGGVMSTPGSGESATWTSATLAPGVYRISATWNKADSQTVPGGTGTLTYAPYTVYVGTGTLSASNNRLQDTVVMQQTVAPSDLTETVPVNGQVVGWDHLGIFQVRQGEKVSVELDAPDNLNNVVIADAIRIELLEPALDSVSLRNGTNSTDINVLANDVGFQAAPTVSDPGWQVQLVGTPAAGTATVNLDGTIHYQFNSGSTATQDTFQYELFDVSTSVTTQPATVLVTRLPSAATIYQAKSFSTNYKSPLTFDVRANDITNGQATSIPTFTAVRNGHRAEHHRPQHLERLRQRLLRSHIGNMDARLDARRSGADAIERNVRNDRARHRPRDGDHSPLAHRSRQCPSG